MGTAYKYGYLYDLGIASKLTRTCDEMKAGLETRGATIKERADFDADYWHAMRKFAYSGPVEEKPIAQEGRTE